MNDAQVTRERDMPLEYRDYGYTSSGPTHVSMRLLPPILELCDALGPGCRVLDVGCGNGFMAGQFLSRGYNVVGVDLSQQGVTIARATYPNARFEVMAADDDLLAKLHEEPFDIVISTEVVEHLYAPRRFAAGCFGALRQGGRLIVTTPYHGYLKNLAVALSNKFDTHVSPLWDGGHIKFWSRETLSELLREVGFHNLQFRGAGRAPYLWMSMVMSGDRPA